MENKLSLVTATHENPVYGFALNNLVSKFKKKKKKDESHPFKWAKDIKKQMEG